MVQMTLSQVRAQQAEVARRKQELIDGLPHLHKFKWYQWAWDFFTSREKMCLMTAANQISKSSTQIRKVIEWAGNPKLWPELWSHTPTIFWYFYPDDDTVQREFENKWMQFLPKGSCKDHPTYGWSRIEGPRIKGVATVKGIKFNSGVTVEFKTYSQQIKYLQSTSLDALFADEEMPLNFYDELKARLYATHGYFNMVFTATLGQDVWRRAIEGKGEQELFPQAFKQQISMYQCQTYMDGSPGVYSKERIDEIIAGCSSKAEVLKRVMGRFVMVGGLKYHAFDATRHFVKPFDVPSDWLRYAAVDIGSGGSAHKPAILFLAARPDLRSAVVYKGWIGDDGSTYTAGDIFSKFLELRGGETLVMQIFDWGAKDFGTIASRAEETFIAAEKSHEIGEGRVNTLFKADAIELMDTVVNRKLGDQLSSVLRETPKQHAVDDLADALRYCVTLMPWDWHYLKRKQFKKIKDDSTRKPERKKTWLEIEIEERRGLLADDREKVDDIYQEFEEFNALGL